MLEFEEVEENEETQRMDELRSLSLSRRLSSFLVPIQVSRRTGEREESMNVGFETSRGVGRVARDITPRTRLIQASVSLSKQLRSIIILVDLC